MGRKRKNRSRFGEVRSPVMGGGGPPPTPTAGFIHPEFGEANEAALGAVGGGEESKGNGTGDLEILRACPGCGADNPVPYAKHVVGGPVPDCYALHHGIHVCRLKVDADGAELCLTHIRDFGECMAQIRKAWEVEEEAAQTGAEVTGYGYSKDADGVWRSDAIKEKGLAPLPPLPPPLPAFDPAISCSKDNPCPKCGADYAAHVVGGAMCKDTIESRYGKMTKDERKSEFVDWRKGDDWHGGGFGYSGGGATTSYLHCDHDGTSGGFVSEGVTVRGARGFSLNGYEADLCLDFAGKYKPDVVGKKFVDGAAGGLAPEQAQGWTDLNALAASQMPVVRFWWADRTVPPVGWLFWEAVWDRIKAAGYQVVVLACEGSHGRTGTGMAALLTVVTNWSAKEIVKFVRKSHCSKAVETKAQEEYVEDLVVQREEELARRKLEAAAPGKGKKAKGGQGGDGKGEKPPTQDNAS